MDFSTRKDLRGINVESEWRLLLTFSQIEHAVRYCAKQIESKFEGQEFVVVCILKASSYHNSQTQAESVELLSVLVPKKFEGKKVILLDELYDNGTTLHLVKQKLLQELNKNEEDIFTCTLFIKKKSEENNKYPPPDLFGIEIPDVWVVGYGLDDCQEKRGWSHLYACPKIEGVPKTEDDQIFSSAEYHEQLLARLDTQVKALPI